MHQQKRNEEEISRSKNHASNMKHELDSVVRMWKELLRNANSAVDSVVIDSHVYYCRFAGLDFRVVDYGLLSCKK